MHHPTDRIVHTTAFVTSVVERYKVCRKITRTVFNITTTRLDRQKLTSGAFHVAILTLLSSSQMSILTTIVALRLFCVMATKMVRYGS